MKGYQRLKWNLQRYFLDFDKLIFVTELRKLFMEQIHTPKHSSFYVVGLNYKKADAEIRGQFTVPADAQPLLLAQAKAAGIESLMINSTCNRTEIYGFAEHPYQLIKLICDHSNGTAEAFQKVGYVYKSSDAVTHVFRVATGLDSQILGDFEIISQIKFACNQSRSFGLINTFLDRLVNAVIQASKRIKNETDLSTGATSVSFAAVQYILRNVPEVSQKNILLFGTGKIGRNTCENLIKHTKNKHITLINRTKEKAERIAGKFNLTVKDFSELQAEIQQSDVLVVATGAQNPTVDVNILNLRKPLLILDLSVPKNVDANVLQTQGVSLIHMDELSKITDDTLEKRRAQIPAAERILEEVKQEFLEWTKVRKFAPTISALKQKLQEIKNSEIDFQSKKLNGFNEEQAEIISNRIIQKITTHFANHLKDDDTSVEESIFLINKIFQLEQTPETEQKASVSFSN